MEKVTSIKKGVQGTKVDSKERKSDFLKEIIKRSSPDYCYIKKSKTNRL